MSDRWIAFKLHRANTRQRLWNLDAMRHGLLPPGWVYGLNDQRQAEFDEQRRILLERSSYLFRMPVTGPDGIAVAIWYQGGEQYKIPMDIPYPRWLASRSGRLAALGDFYIRWKKRMTNHSYRAFIVQAHAMSGPPAAVIRSFLTKQDAADFATQLTRRVRTGGVKALRRDAWPDPADRIWQP